jgi:hypothetical protein
MNSPIADSSFSFECENAELFNQVVVKFVGDRADIGRRCAEHGQSAQKNPNSHVLLAASDDVPTSNSRHRSNTLSFPQWIHRLTILLCLQVVAKIYQTVLKNEQMNVKTFHMMAK